jgi:hypothetical protein
MAPNEYDENFDPLSPYNFRGSSKFFDAPDTIITFQPIVARPGEWARVRTGWKLRQAPEPEKPLDLLVLEREIVKPVPGGRFRAPKYPGSSLG